MTDYELKVPGSLLSSLLNDDVTIPKIGGQLGTQSQGIGVVAAT